MALRATVKVTQGWLYPLTGGFCFVEKPTLYLRRSSIASIEFARAGGSSSTFDIVVHMKGGEAHEFAMIDSQELQAVMNYIHDRKIRVGSPEEDDDEEGEVRDWAWGPG